ncbi:hypothetical protein FNV43_RR25990 [Rhamnella rubrinervis]|uniref:protein-disulfide reductase n=1 Tax=Rhamnella rubrinervis TaxID=2594499 RepID=A0A8K0GR23_9ROSA|nr:hypothetical protein FNV43_RR25990 [Rhamnella rubrinervis]
MAESGSYDLLQLLSWEKRDFLIRNNGEQVKISGLIGKTVESFIGHFSKMPWLAVPFSDSPTKKRLKKLFKVMGIPEFVILDANGNVSTQEGTKVVWEYGAEGFPFTLERISFLIEEERAAKLNQSLNSMLVSSTSNYLISNYGNLVPVSELENKTVVLFFTMKSHRQCLKFTPLLIETYKDLKDKGCDFEVVSISQDRNDKQFREGFATLPWLALPFNNKVSEKLARYFDLRTLPTLVIIGPNGKTLRSNAVELIEDYGSEGYPFTSERLTQVAEDERAKREAQTLECLLVSGDRDFVMENSGFTTPISDLVGKHILLFVSALHCASSRTFLSKLVQTYFEIKSKVDDAFEVIFVSCDVDNPTFCKYFDQMPWLAIPYVDARRKSILRWFRIRERDIPKVIAIGPSGRTVTTEARKLIRVHGEEAFPFTEEHMKSLKEEIKDMVQGWPETVMNCERHQHELLLIDEVQFNCFRCREMGFGWFYYCEECDFALHPVCALMDKEKPKEEDKKNVTDENAKESKEEEEEETN